MWSKEVPACTIDTLLNQRDCVTNLAEWVEYNLDRFPGLKNMIEGVVLELKLKTRNKPSSVSVDSPKYLESMATVFAYENHVDILAKYETFLRTWKFYFLGAWIFTDAGMESVIKYYGVTISPSKDSTIKLRVNYDILTKTQ